MKVDRFPFLEWWSHLSLKAMNLYLGIRFGTIWFGIPDLTANAPLKAVRGSQFRLLTLVRRPVEFRRVSQAFWDGAS